MRLKISQVITFFVLYSTIPTVTSKIKEYHSTDTLLTRIKLKCATVPQLSCHMKDDILVVDWNKNVSNKADVLLVFNEHARERVTGELALKVIHKLRKWNPKARVTLIPVLNVWGRKHVEKGHPCQRKNQRGVDTNRNYQMQSNKHRYSKGGEEFEGEKPLSEKESQLVAGILRTGVRRYVNVHSGEKSIYMPYDSRVGSRPKNHKVMEKNIKKWAEACPECAVGSAASTSFYRAYGTSVDYAVDMVGVPEAYTFEIYGDASLNCDKMFNPSKYELHHILKQWSGILKQVVLQ